MHGNGLKGSSFGSEREGGLTPSNARVTSTKRLKLSEILFNELGYFRSRYSMNRSLSDVGRRTANVSLIHPKSPFSPSTCH